MLTIKLLGQFEIRANGEPLVLPTRASQTLAAWLLLKPGITHRREHIAGTIWPDSTEKNARGNLRHALWELRQAIPDGYVQADQMSITWHSDTAYQLDVDLLLHNGETTENADQVALAVAAYGGELLPGFYEDWVTLERERLHARFEEKAARLLELLLAQGRWRDALHQAERWIAFGQTPEAAYRALMTAHTALGDTAAASKAWQRCVDALERELGVPPSPETAALYERYRSGFRPDKMDSISADPSVALPPVHRATASALPAQTTPFVGRTQEVAALNELIADPAHRLITILGPGGMGKTRLALAAAAAQVNHFPDGVYFVPLAGADNATAIVPAIMTALHFRFPDDSRTLQQQLLAHLADRRLLLLLDNFEHLLDGAQLLVELLQAAPGLQLIVTSRERLRLQAETLFRLSGMGYPVGPGNSNQPTEQYEAVAFFVQCARRLRLHFDPQAEMDAIVHICRAVGGMPLGLVLAAAWMDILSPAEIAAEISQGLGALAAELADLDVRHRSIEGVLAQSWARLDRADRSALMALSVFADDFSREAAQAVAGAALRTLAVLADRSLLARREDGRYSLHQLVRQFAGEKLDTKDEYTAVRQRHSRWFLGFVAQREAAIKGRGQEIAFAEIEIELQNVQLAWRWAAENRDITAISSALECLGIFYNRTQYQREGPIPMGQAAEGIGTPQTGAERVLLLRIQGWQAIFLHYAGHTQASNALMEQCIAGLSHPDLAVLDTRGLVAFLHLHRGGQILGDLHRSRTAQEQAQAVALYRELGDAWWLRRALRALGNLEIFASNYRVARELLTEAQAIAERIDDRAGLVDVMDRLSHLAEISGELEEAERLVNQAIVLNQDELPFSLNLHIRLSFILHSGGRFQQAADSMEAVAQRYRQLNLTRGTGYPYVQNGIARIQLHLGNYALACEIATTSLNDWTRVFGWEPPFFLRTLGRALLGLGQWEEGHQTLSRAYSGQVKVSDSAISATRTYLEDLLYAELKLGMGVERFPRLVESIGRVHAIGEDLLVVKSLPGVGLALAQRGDWAESAAVYHLSLRYPHIANSRWYAVVAMDPLEELLAHLPPDTRAAAKERGRALELPEMTAELLSLLS
ncbi:MAG: BTAD domain-containing putative transcriptional regulator [Caldilineaceae bacterium]